ncbi:MAG: hypothetical protein ACP5I1_05570 [Candidatus Hinthialibacter sp.]
MAPSLTAQIAPTFELEEPVILAQDLLTARASMAINSDEPEALFVTVDTMNSLGFTDPITGEAAATAVLGFFYNTLTLEPIGEPFIVVGNPDGDFDTLDVDYNSFTKEYIVAASANNYRPNNVQINLLAIVQSDENNPLVKAWAYDPESANSFDDVAVSASSNNGNILMVSEYSFPGEGEGVIGVLYDSEGGLLTSTRGRLDVLQAPGDEDDPDVVFLPNNDVFLFLVNTDYDDVGPYFDRITGAVVLPVPDENGNLQIGEQQILGADRKDGMAQGHPAAIENPWTDELIGVFDYNNGSDGGDVFYFTVGEAPAYQLSESREQIPYLEASGSNPVNHRHPQLAADPSSGVIVVAYNINNDNNALEMGGMLFTLLGPDGQVLPANELSLVEDQVIYSMTPDEIGTISNDANNHHTFYDPHSDSFISIFATSEQYTKAVRLRITSDHSPVRVNDWNLF